MSVLNIWDSNIFVILACFRTVFYKSDLHNCTAVKYILRFMSRSQLVGFKVFSM